MYLNNAATSYPKPKAVIEAVRRALEAPPEEPGRSGRGADPRLRCRRAIAELFDVADPRQVVLLASATEALNLALWGLAETAGRGRLVTSALEHNSVLRPLEHLRLGGRFELVVLKPDREGRLEPEAVREALAPGAALAAFTCASNVSGAVQPAEALAEEAARAGVPLILDTAQSGGAIALSHKTLPGRVFVAFAGHKGLMGPAGTGGLIVPDGELPQLLVGGTGIRSESPTHPGELPLRHEAGTPNLPGIAGLTAGCEEVLSRGVAALGQGRERLVGRLREALARVPSIELWPLPGGDGRAGIVTFHHRSKTAEEVGFTLREVFGVEVRTGLHCAPLVHGALGGPPLGCVRASVGAYSTEADVDQLAAAMVAIGAGGCS